MMSYTLLRNSTNNTATCEVINYELNQTAESPVMDEEQFHRPRERWNMRPLRGVREKEDYRQAGRT